MALSVTYTHAYLNAAGIEGSLAIGLSQRRQHSTAIKFPPQGQVIRVHLAEVRGQRMPFDLATLGVVRIVPRLHFPQEVDHLGIPPVPVHTRLTISISNIWLTVCIVLG